MTPKSKDHAEQLIAAVNAFGDPAMADELRRWIQADAPAPEKTTKPGIT